MNVLKWFARSIDALLLIVLVVFALHSGVPLFLNGTHDDRLVAGGLGVMILGLVVSMRYELLGGALLLLGFGGWWGGALQEQVKWPVIAVTPLVPALAFIFALHWWLERDDRLHH